MFVPTGRNLQSFMLRVLGQLPMRQPARLREKSLHDLTSHGIVKTEESGRCQRPREVGGGGDMLAGYEVAVL